MIICPVCEMKIEGSLESLSFHFISLSHSSDPDHVKWLSRNISMEKLTQEKLTNRFELLYSLEEEDLSGWIRNTFIKKFFSESPNPFVKAMQNPSKFTIMGYVTEHYHFLRQWIKSCAFVMAKSDYYDVQKYELNNITEEYFGNGSAIPHVELLLRMGESLGLQRDKVINSTPLTKTKHAIDFWKHVSTDGHWLDAMVSLHSLELIADRNVKKYGATYSYFDPSVLEGDLPREVKDFLRAGYEADQYHSSDALKIIEKYATLFHMEKEVQSYFLKSSDYFYDYLNARLERGIIYEKEL